MSYFFLFYAGTDFVALRARKHLSQFLKMAFVFCVLCIFPVFFEGLKIRICHCDTTRRKRRWSAVTPASLASLVVSPLIDGRKEREVPEEVER